MNITFITGTGRCGSNILCRLFSKHPDVATLPFETRYLIDPDGIIDFMHSIQCWSPYMANKKIQRLEDFLLTLTQKRSEFYTDWELEKHIPGYTSYVQRLIDSLKEFYYKWDYPRVNLFTGGSDIYYASVQNRMDSIKAFLREFVLSTYKAIIGDKKYYVDDNTWSCLFAKEIHELLPEAKFVYLFRNPKDNIADFIQQRWLPSDYIHATKIYKDLIQKWNESKDYVPKNNYIEISFENMIRMKEVCIRDICGFTGIPFHNSLMETELLDKFIDIHRKVFTVEQIDFLEKQL